MSRPVLVALALVLAFLPGASSADDPATKPYDAYLPNPDWTESDPPIPYHAARLVDAETREPIEGAWLRGYEEDVHPHTVEYAELLREGQSNADGIAWVRDFDEPLIDHWVASAPGYAPAYHFGYEPPPTMRLRRGANARGQIVGALGDPVPGLEIDVFLGCVHGPVMGTVTTGEDGRVELPPFDPDEMARMAFATPRGRYDMQDATNLGYAAAFGRPMWLGASRTVRGQVLNPVGTPVKGVAVRLYGVEPPTPGEDPGFRRGPATQTDDDGRFVLHGMPPRDSPCGLLITPPGPLFPRHVRVPNTPEPDLTVRIPVPDEGETGQLALEPTANGKPWPSLPRAYAVRDDGAGFDLGTEPDARRRVPVGRYTILPASAFLDETFEPVTVEVRANERVSVVVEVREQPRAVLAEGSGPQDRLAIDETAILVTQHEERMTTVGELRFGGVPVPATDNVALFVGDRLFRLGTVADGRRTARVTLPESFVLRFEAPFEVDSVTLWQNGMEHDWPEVIDGKAETWCRGSLVAEIQEDDGGTWRVPIELTGEPREVVVDVAERATSRPNHGPLSLSWRLADGTTPEDIYLEAWPLAGTFESMTVSGGEPPEDELEGPCRVRLSSPGLQTLEAIVPAGKQELVWGPNNLVLEAFAPDGTRVQSVVMVDGYVHRDYADEPFRLGGLSAGRHRVVVTPFDLRWRGVEMTMDLSERETRREVRFTSR